MNFDLIFLYLHIFFSFPDTLATVKALFLPSFLNRLPLYLHIFLPKNYGQHRGWNYQSTLVWQLARMAPSWTMRWPVRPRGAWFISSKTPRHGIAQSKTIIPENGGTRMVISRTCRPCGQSFCNPERSRWIQYPPNDFEYKGFVSCTPTEYRACLAWWRT